MSAQPSGRAMWVDVHADHPRPQDPPYEVIDRGAAAIRAAAWEDAGRDVTERPWETASEETRTYFRRVALAAWLAMGGAE